MFISLIYIIPLITIGYPFCYWDRTDYGGDAVTESSSYICEWGFGLFSDFSITLQFFFTGILLIPLIIIMIISNKKRLLGKHSN